MKFDNKILIFISSVLSFTRRQTTFYDAHDHGVSWGGACATGKNQSPIEFKTGETKNLTVFRDSINAMEIYPGGKIFESKEKDIHEALKLQYDFTEEIKIPNYRCPQIHFHFNHSEHAIDGWFTFGESHLVCYADHYYDLTEALANRLDNNSVAVFGVLIDAKEGYELNQDFQSIIDAHNSGVTFLEVLPEPEDRQAGFYRYNGSLTTPDCNEGVVWTVFKSFLKISLSQAAEIINWHDDTLDNHRYLQPLNNRTVFFFV